jgi:hypothetical protein
MLNIREWKNNMKKKGKGGKIICMGSKTELKP